MTIQEVENLSAAELKAKRGDIIASLIEYTPAEVAERYAQARTDSKMRDEKLADQGRTITALEELVKAAKEQNELLKVNLSAATTELANVKQQATELFEKCKTEHKTVCEAAAKEHADVCAAHDKLITELKAELETTQAELAKQRQRGDRLKTQANRNNAAINAAATQLNGVIAAQLVDNADEGA